MMILKHIATGVSFLGAVCVLAAADFRIPAETLRGGAIAPPGVDQVDGELGNLRRKFGRSGTVHAELRFGFISGTPGNGRYRSQPHGFQRIPPRLEGRILHLRAECARRCRAGEDGHGFDHFRPAGQSGRLRAPVHDRDRQGAVRRRGRRNAPGNRAERAGRPLRQRDLGGLFRRFRELRRIRPDQKSRIQSQQPHGGHHPGVLNR